jgi:hypothetical protein
MAAQQEISSDRTQTEQANSAFSERVLRLPGVRRVEAHQSRTTSEQSFTVYVGSGDLCARNAVYDLESELYAEYPGARVDVHVREER